MRSKDDTEGKVRMIIYAVLAAIGLAIASKVFAIIFWRTGLEFIERVLIYEETDDAIQGQGERKKE